MPPFEVHLVFPSYLPSNHSQQQQHALHQHFTFIASQLNVITKSHLDSFLQAMIGDAVVQRLDSTVQVVHSVSRKLNHKVENAINAQNRAEALSMPGRRKGKNRRLIKSTVLPSVMIERSTEEKAGHSENSASQNNYTPEHVKLHLYLNYTGHLLFSPLSLSTDLNKSALNQLVCSAFEGDFGQDYKRRIQTSDVQLLRSVVMVEINVNEKLIREGNEMHTIFSSGEKEIQDVITFTKRGQNKKSQTRNYILIIIVPSVVFCCVLFLFCSILFRKRRNRFGKDGQYLVKHDVQLKRNEACRLRRRHEDGSFPTIQGEKEEEDKNTSLESDISMLDPESPRSVMSSFDLQPVIEPIFQEGAIVVPVPASKDQIDVPLQFLSEGTAYGGFDIPISRRYISTNQPGEILYGATFAHEERKHISTKYHEGGKKRMSRKLVEVCKRVRRKHTEPSFAVAKGNHENRSAAVGNLEGNIASRTEGKHGTMWTTQDRRRVRPFLSNMFVIEEEDENESISTACTYEVDETSHPKFHEVAIGGSCSKMQIRAL
mmetsp:Transcript_41865/g.63268  ORF Transcript_41865/g.63268 Transcript_41865/m.63268 type:complete len:544 (+) Transcript_41865:3-1634(+)